MHSNSNLTSSVLCQHLRGRTRICFPTSLARGFASTSAARKPGVMSSSKDMLAQADAPLPPSPLAAMPTGMLLRSLMIATVSSHRLLLNPSLRLLAFFDQPNRSFFFDVDRNPILHTILKATVYNQFCAGETLEETGRCVRRLKGLGFRGVILTYAKELVHNHSSADAPTERTSAKLGVGGDSIIEEWRKGTSRTADLLERGDILAIKLTGAGPAVAGPLENGTRAPHEFYEALEGIVAKCERDGIQVIVDAESQRFQGGIDSVSVELMRKFNRGKVVVYNTYQAYLKHTPQTIENHLAEADKHGFTMGLKLVRGAYLLSDDRPLIHDTKEGTDKAYNDIVHGVLSRQLGPFGSLRPFPSLQLFLASHNRVSVLSALSLHRQRTRAGLPTVPVAFGQLHGMSDEVSFSLLREADDQGERPDVFKCTTWGTMGECIGYLLRRAVENRDAVLRTRDEFVALRTEVWRRLMSPFSSPPKFRADIGPSWDCATPCAASNLRCSSTWVPRAHIQRPSHLGRAQRRSISLETPSAAPKLNMHGPTLCILGCGNLGIPILKGLIATTNNVNDARFDRFIACVRSEASEQRVVAALGEHQTAADKLTVSKNRNIEAVLDANVVILGVDPADVHQTLGQRGMKEALRGRLLISIAAGWTREKIENYVSKESGSERTWVIRTLPNIAAQVSQSLTAIEEPPPETPRHHIATTEAIFNKIGRTVCVSPRLMNATTAVGGSTPAMFAIICDALIDAAVAVGVPRALAQSMIFQSMKGTAEMLQSGIHPSLLKDQGTSPEGCTIAGLMVMEEAGLRGGLGKALREAVTVARLMDGSADLHVNDTRQSHLRR